MTWGTFEAGTYQVIMGTTVSDTYRFAIWGMGWTQEQPTPTNPEDWYRSDYTQTGGLSFRVGIDPRGGESYTSTNIIWSDFYDPYDAWHRFEITATAAATRISVWAYANPQGWWLWHNETFWDNANLEVISMP
jgi:hypothetical protein